MTAFLEYGAAQEYYVASAADRVIMLPGGTLDLTGVASYELFFRGALDKIGAYPDLLHIGEYKTFSNTFTEKGFTPAHREMTAIAQPRLVRPARQGDRRRAEAAGGRRIRAIDGGPYLAEGAKSAGLVDAVAYEDQIDDSAPVKGRDGSRATPTPEVPLRSLGLGAGPRIAVLYATGTIASGTSSFDSPTGAVLGSETFVQWIRKVRVDPGIRAIVVRIDSPGGSAIASEVIWREMMLTRAIKPLIVSMGNVAASGGYYIAVPAETIVAEAGTITGSIGVVTGKFVVKGTLEKLGVAEDSVSEGRFAELESPFTPFSKPQRARMEEQLHATYDLFLSRVAEGRKSTPETHRLGRSGTRVDGPAGAAVEARGRARRARDGDRHCQTAGQTRPEQGRAAGRVPAETQRLRAALNPFGASLESAVGLALLRRPEARAGRRGHLDAPPLPTRRAAHAIMPNVFLDELGSETQSGWRQLAQIPSSVLIVSEL